MATHKTMSVRELAVLLGIQLNSAYHLVWSGKVAAEYVQVSGRPSAWLVDSASAQEYRAKRDAKRAEANHREQAKEQRKIERVERDRDFQRKREALAR